MVPHTGVRPGLSLPKVDGCLFQFITHSTTRRVNALFAGARPATPENDRRRCTARIVGFPPPSVDDHLRPGMGSINRSLKGENFSNYLLATPSEKVSPVVTSSCCPTLVQAASTCSENSDSFLNPNYSQGRDPLIWRVPWGLSYS